MNHLTNIDNQLLSIILIAMTALNVLILSYWIVKRKRALKVIKKAENESEKMNEAITQEKTGKLFKHLRRKATYLVYDHHIDEMFLTRDFDEAENSGHFFMMIDLNKMKFKKASQIWRNIINQIDK